MTQSAAATPQELCIAFATPQATVLTHHLQNIKQRPTHCTLHSGAHAAIRLQLAPQRKAKTCMARTETHVMTTSQPTNTTPFTNTLRRNRLSKSAPRKERLSNKCCTRLHKCKHLVWHTTRLYCCSRKPHSATRLLQFIMTSTCLLVVFKKDSPNSTLMPHLRHAFHSHRRSALLLHQCTWQMIRHGFACLLCMSVQHCRRRMQHCGINNVPSCT